MMLALKRIQGNLLQCHLKLIKSNFKDYNKLFQNEISFSTTSLNNLNLNGIYPPIPTPFQENQSIAYDKLKSNFDKWNLIPFKGYVIEGSNGEYVYLTSEERIELVKVAKKFAANDKFILVGSGCESTLETIDMTNKMAEVGADAALVVTPSYYKSGMKDKALFNHYEELANKSTIPIILYNVPANTGVELSTSVICSLAKHDNIIGLKESGGDISKIGDVLNRTKGENFQVLAGSAGFLLASLYLGCVGGVCALANVLGNEVCELYSLFLKGDTGKAIELQKKLIGPNFAVTKFFGVPGLKEIMDAKGYFGGRTRLPLHNLNTDEKENLYSLFREVGYF